MQVLSPGPFSALSFLPSSGLLSRTSVCPHCLQERLVESRSRVGLCIFPFILAVSPALPCPALKLPEAEIAFSNP